MKPIVPNVMKVMKGLKRPKVLKPLECLALALGLAAVSCSTDSNPPGAGTGEEQASDLAGKEFPDQEMTTFVLRQTDEEGRPEWLLRAVTGRIYERRDEVEADQIQIDFYDVTGAVSSVLTADHGVIKRRTNDMRAFGNVKVVNRESHELQTEELQYSTQRHQIYTDGFVRIVRGRDVLTGYGLATDPNLAGGQFEIQRDVQATVLGPTEADGVHASPGSVPGGKTDGSETP